MYGSGAGSIRETDNGKHEKRKERPDVGKRICKRLQACQTESRADYAGKRHKQTEKMCGDRLFCITADGGCTDCIFLSGDSFLNKKPNFREILNEIMVKTRILSSFVDGFCFTYLPGGIIMVLIKGEMKLAASGIPGLPISFRKYFLIGIIMEICYNNPY